MPTQAVMHRNNMGMIYKKITGAMLKIESKSGQPRSRIIRSYFIRPGKY